MQKGIICNDLCSNIKELHSATKESGKSINFSWKPVKNELKPTCDDYYNTGTLIPFFY